MIYIIVAVYRVPDKKEMEQWSLRNDGVIRQPGQRSLAPADADNVTWLILHAPPFVK